MDRIMSTENLFQRKSIAKEIQIAQNLEPIVFMDIAKVF